jgi:hypothetical protein
VDEKYEHFERECHALWTYLEAKLETLWVAQVVLSLNILAHVLEFLSKRVLHAWISKNNFQFFFKFSFKMT